MTLRHTQDRLRNNLTRCVALIVLLGGVPQALAQVCPVPGADGPTASLSGVVNEYFPGTSSVGAGGNTITVGASRNGGAISAGDLLLVVQMQDATIYTSNDHSYGDGPGGYGATASGSTSIGQTGLYEYVIATSSVAAGGGTVTVFGEGAGNGLLNAYNAAAATTTRGQRTFQLVRVPQYSNATISGSVNASAWNGATGGIVVMDVAGDLTFAGGNIDVQGQGFRGGGGRKLNGAAGALVTDVMTSNTAAAHASKGEGIAGTPRYISACHDGPCNPTIDTGGPGYPGGAGTGYDMARGAPGNAGGGGTDGAPANNSQNAGGGGGGNFGAGGKGGNGWCDSSLDAGCPGTAAQTGGWGGTGYGGSLGIARLFMGGGGGAGVSSDGTATGFDGRASSGAPGGGIIILRAGRVQGAATLYARGLGGNTSAGIDASGGGGAGGSIVVHETNPGTGTITMDASGGTGGSNSPQSFQGPHGPGGGGGGGLVLTNIGLPTINAAGGANGGTVDASNAVIDYGATPGAIGGVNGVAGSQIPGVDAPAGCLPMLSVTKATSTPTVAASSGATASYTVTVSNTGGGARNVSIIESALPPGWTLSGTPTYAYSPAPTGGAWAAGAEAIASGASFPLRAGSAAPGTVPAAGANALNWGSFFIPKGGSVAVTYSVSIPDSAAVGTYHSPAGITFLDPTRSTTGRLVSPATGISANRTGTAYSVNTTYENGAGAPVNVGGSNYSGLEAGPTTEDVRLLPDLAVTLTHVGSLIPGAVGQSYTLTARNNGRAIRDLLFVSDQASTVALASVPATLGGNPITVTDNFQTGLTLGGVPSGTNWSCAGAAAGNSTFSCTYSNAAAYPLAAATNLPALTVPVAVTTAACGATGANTALVGNAAAESLTANNTATDVTVVSCGQAVDVVNALNTGSTQVSTAVFDVPYRVQVKNTGGVDAPNLQVVDNLASTFSSGAPTLAWSSAPIVSAIAPATASQCALNPAFVAAPGAATIFDGRQSLSAGGSCVVTFTVRVTYASTGTVPTGVQNNSVVASSYAVAPANAGGSGTTPLATDTSTNGTTPPATANGDVASPTPVTLAGIDLQLGNVVNGALTVGQGGSYTLTPRNAGGAPTVGTITVTDTLPAGLQFVSASGSGWSCAAAGQTVTCTSTSAIAGNANGNPITLNVSVLSSAVPANSSSANVTNVAAVSGGAEPAGATANNTASITSVVSVPGAASGSAWRDTNGNRVRDGGEVPLAGWKVEIVDPNTGAIVKTATTGGDGVYSLTGLPPGSYRLRFRDPVNNVIYGTPVNGEQGAGSAQSGSAVAADRSALDVTILAGQTLAQQSLSLNPTGVVYDSDTRQPLAGASVQVCGPTGFSPVTQLVGGSSYAVAGSCATMVTSNNGFYQVLLSPGAPSGTYTLAVAPPSGYVASTLAAVAGPLTPPTGVGPLGVQSQASPPVGSQPVTYYASLALAATRQDVVNNHIPLDPLVRPIIVVDKRASVTEAEIGDLVAYTVTVRSLQGGGFPQLNFIDRLPAGFRYVPGTARIQRSGSVGMAVQPDPAGGVGPVLSFDVTGSGSQVLGAGGTLTLTYRVRVAAGAQQGDGINHVIASSGRTTSNEAMARVKVTGGVFTTEACLIGKVYLDCNGNRMQDSGESGVPGVRLYFEDGTYLVSDAEGKYSLCGLRPTTHVLKADRTSLPLGARLGIVDNRNALDAESAFVDLRNGELHRTDFILQSCSPEVTDQIRQRRERADAEVRP